MLVLVGLGLGSEKDLTLRGLEEAKGSDVVYLEGYTSSLVDFDLARLCSLLGKKVVVLGRGELEEGLKKLLLLALEKKVCVLVGGDPLVATTHKSIVLEAEKMGVETRVVHNASILTAVCEAGLDAYCFGKTTTLVFPKENYFPTSFYEAVRDNKLHGLHSLVLLDVSEERGFMGASEALGLLLEAEEDNKEGLLSRETWVLVAAGVGSEKQRFVYGQVGVLLEVKDFGPQPQCLVLPGRLHFLEEEALLRFLPR